MTPAECLRRLHDIASGAAPSAAVADAAARQSRETPAVCRRTSAPRIPILLYSKKTTYVPAPSRWAIQVHSWNEIPEWQVTRPAPQGAEPAPPFTPGKIGRWEVLGMEQGRGRGTPRAVEPTGLMRGHETNRPAARNEEKRQSPVRQEASASAASGVRGPETSPR